MHLLDPIGFMESIFYCSKRRIGHPRIPRRRSAMLRRSPRRTGLSCNRLLSLLRTASLSGLGADDDTRRTVGPSAVFRSIVTACQMIS